MLKRCCSYPDLPDTPDICDTPSGPTPSPSPRQTQVSCSLHGKYKTTPSGKGWEDRTACDTRHFENKELVVRPRCWLWHLSDQHWITPGVKMWRRNAESTCRHRCSSTPHPAPCRLGWCMSQHHQSHRNGVTQASLAGFAAEPAPFARRGEDKGQLLSTSHVTALTQC